MYVVLSDIKLHIVYIVISLSESYDALGQKNVNNIIIPTLAEKRTFWYDVDVKPI